MSKYGREVDNFCFIPTLTVILNYCINKSLFIISSYDVVLLKNVFLIRFILYLPLICNVFM